MAEDTIERLRLALKKRDGRPATKKSLFIFGISGFVGKRLARFCSTELGSEFVEVSGTTRTLSSVNTAYIEHVLNADGSLPLQAREALLRATHVLSTVPTVTDNTLEDGIIELKTKQGTLEWAGYLSTTAAYGDRGGGLVTEDDEVNENALSPRGLERVRVEEKWFAIGAPAHVFRLPGIYGPGRGPLAKARERSNRLVVKEGQVFCRVHVDDIVQALVLSMSKPNPGRVYNICDNEPAPSHEVSLLAYKLLDKTSPPLVKYEDVEKDLSPMMRSFYAECKRVSNERIKLELGFWPLYPSYREGLPAQLAEEGANFQAVPVSSSQPSTKFEAAKNERTIAAQFLKSWISMIRSWFTLAAARIKVWTRAIRYFYFVNVIGFSVILVDNGSVRPGATLGMRRLAAKLNGRLGVSVHPTSWRYSDRIDKTVLDGVSAQMFTPTLEKESSKFVVILPLFVGPSAIITREVPKLLSRSTQMIARPLVDVQQTSPCVITALLFRAALRLNGGKPFSKKTKILLVDHGSPSREVNKIRRALGGRLRAQVYPAKVVDCSMERREDSEYDFNEPTLEHAFELGGFDRGEVLLVPAFLFPGNHAGPGGDIATIVDEAMAKHATLNVKIGMLLMDDINDDVIVPLLASTIERALL